MTIKERLRFIRKAFSTIKDEMLISLGIIIVLTGILSILFFVAERIAQPDVFADYGDAIVWA